MKNLAAGVTVTLGGALACAVVACSAASSDGPGGTSNTGGFFATGGGGGVPGGGGGGGNTPGGGGLIGNTGGLISLGGSANGGANGSGGAAENCGTTSKPEEIIQFEPAGIFIMQDRSGSMVTGFPPPASPQGWQNSMTAVTAFVNDPSSAGLYVGLGAFPPMTGAADCATGSTCGQPIVPMQQLPANAQAIATGMQNATPNNPLSLTPIECGLRGMAAQCAAFKQANPAIPCAGVLVTDGTPTECSPDQAVLNQVVADANAAGFKTFVIGLPGSNIQSLNQLAQAGGTNQAIDVGSGSQQFIAALNAIRNQVSVGTKLQCEWIIPEPPAGKVFDKTKVNLKFTPKNGTPVDFGYVASEAACAGTTNSWHFDNEADPKKILVCGSTCDMLKNSSGAQMDVEFGCARRPAMVE